MIEPPLWLVVLPLAATPLVYLARRWQLGAYLAAAVSLFTGLLAATLPPTNIMRLGGRTFLLDPLTQQGLAVFFITCAILYMIGWRLRQGEYLLPLGVFVSGLFAIAGMSRHLAITGLVMTLAAIASVPIIQGERTASVRAAWRFLLFMVLALPFFLLAAWRVDMYREDIQNAVYLPQAAVLAGLGLCFWLAAIPMYSWLTSVAAGAPPVAGVLVLIGFPMMALITLAHLMAEATWFTWWAQAGHLLLMAGLVSTALGGVLAAVQRSLRSAMGYTALFDMGCLLVAFAVQGSDGAVALYAGLVTRAIGLTLIGVATAAIQAETGEDSFAHLPGAASRLPLAAGALLMGGITMAGLPGAAGFPVRWLTLHNLAQVDSRLIWVIVLASLGVAIAYLRAVYAMMKPASQTYEASRSRPVWAPTALMMSLILVTTTLGLFPGPLFRLAARLVTLYPLPHL